MKPLTLASLTTTTVLGLGLLTVGCTPNQLSSGDTVPPTSPSDTAPPTSPVETSVAQPDPVQTATESPGDPIFFAEEGVAIRGADPVAYFTQAAYVPGSADYTYDWEGVTWQFASAENRDLFASNPEQYAPQYGGYCAWAVSQGYTAPVDPTAWKVVEGKLYLNYDAGVQKTWEKDISGNIAKGNQNWPAVLSQ